MKGRRPCSRRFWLTNEKRENGRTVRRRSAGSHAPQARIEEIAQGVTQHVEPEHRQREREAGEDREPLRGSG